MTTYTRSAFCQGHGGGRECRYAPEVDGCLDHGDDFDHGVISFCDGSCGSALDAWQDWLAGDGRIQQPLGIAGRITLDVRGHGYTPESYRVVFEGPDAEARALAYIAPRRGYYFSEAIDAPNYWPALSDALAAVLYPRCHHGLDATACMDPIGEHHFGTLAQEMANGW